MQNTLHIAEFDFSHNQVSLIWILVFYGYFFLTTNKSKNLGYVGYGQYFIKLSSLIWFLTLTKTKTKTCSNSLTVFANLPSWEDAAFKAD